MLTNRPENARRVAGDADRARRSSFLAAHRRIEIVVALLALAAVALLISDAEQASAAPPPVAEEVQFEASPSSQPPRQTAEPSTEVPTEDEAAPIAPATPVRESGLAQVSELRTSPTRIFLGSRQDARFGFELDGSSPRKLLVKVVHVSSGQVVRRVRLGRVEPGTRQQATWDGKRRNGSYAGEGEYAFRVYSDGERAGTAKSRGSTSSPRFGFYGHRFPLLGRHTYGDGFGAGRNHQGQDIFASCGTRVVAARGGRVQARSYHSSAGYYVVIDGRGTGQDYAYMHLARGDRPAAGSWVATGELLGRESDTGNASGCHLHFEIWSAPGWYQGGHAKAPTRALKRWDGWS